MHSDKKNSFWLSFQFISMLLISLITLKLNLSNFGNHQFGIWILLAAVWGFGFAIDFGFGTALIKYVAEFNRYEKENVNKLLSTSLFVFLIAAFILFCIGIVAGELFFFSDMNLVNSAESPIFRKVFLVLGLSFIIQYITIFFKSTLEGLNNFVLTSKITLLYNFLILLGVIIVSLLKLSIIYLALVYLISWFAILIMYIVRLKLNYPELSLRLKNFDLLLIKKIVKFSFSVQLISVFTALIDPVIKYIIGSFYQVGFVSSYEIARRFALAISGLFFAAFKIILPKASVLKTKEEFKKFVLGDGLSFTKIGLTYSGLVFGVSTFIIVMIISWWFNSPESIVIFLLLALPESINNVGFTNYMFLIGIGKAHIIAMVQFVNITVISVTLIIGFTLFDSIFGLLGYFVTVLFVNVFILLYIRKIIDISIIDYLRKLSVSKLVMLLGMLLLSPIIVYLNLLPLYLVLSLLSGFSLIIFRKDLYNYSGIFLKYLMGKNV